MFALASRRRLSPNFTAARPAMLACVAAAIGGLAASAHATVTNGSFELPPVTPGTFSVFGGGSTSITGWTVVGGNVAVISASYVEGGVTFNAQSGAQWLDLTGTGSNSLSNGVSQDVATTIGQLYRLSFYVGSATDNNSFSASTVDLSIGGGGRASFTNPTAPRTTMDWQLFTADFTATSTLTNITFFNGSAPNNNLSGLDNVTLAVIPAPGAAALLGLCGLLAARRRRA
ncbi:MAG: DUF642 domain-containing protein [Phycisphaerales bacterium]|nr:DUF642 domain-containing protein [Phycisphaerales bacterium]